MLEAVLIHRAWQGIASFAYDDADRVSEVATLVNGNLTSVLHDLEFEPFGPRKTAAYGPGGLTDTRTYDHRYLLDNWTLGSLIDYTHVFNGDENLVSRKIGVNDDRIFDYDAAHRLVLAQAPALWGEGTACGHQTYTYDANGNRTCKNDKGGSSTDTYDYVTGDRLYSSQSAGEFKYEADGLIADDGNHTYVYDAADRLVSVDPDAFVPTATYTYDGNGRRVSKTTYGPGGRTTWFLYAPDGTLLTEMIPAEGTGTDYIHVASGPLARVDWSGLPGIDPEGVSSGDAIESIDSPGPVEGHPSLCTSFTTITWERPSP